MNRLIARASTIAAAGLLATVAVTGSAQAEPITASVPGCWGGGTNDTIVCDLILTANVPEPTPKTIYVKVCAGTCQDVPVNYVSTGSVRSLSVCYSYEDGWGTEHSDCVSLTNSSSLVKDLRDFVLDLLDCSNYGCPQT